MLIPALSKRIPGREGTMAAFLPPGPSSRRLGPHGNLRASQLISLTDVPRLKDESISQGRDETSPPSIPRWGSGTVSSPPSSRDTWPPPPPGEVITACLGTYGKAVATVPSARRCRGPGAQRPGPGTAPPPGRGQAVQGWGRGGGGRGRTTEEAGVTRASFARGATETRSHVRVSHH